jgi:hypothetical protein
MRANEYIEINQSSIEYLDDIKRVIADLLPLRKDKYATDEYYNRYLLSDWRFSLYNKDMQDFQLSNGNITNKPVLKKYDGEIAHAEASAFRNQLFEVIKDDTSFGYLFYQLGVEKNQKSAFYKSKPIQCIPDDNVIIKAIIRYRDDYPKNTLDEYLDDSFNYDHYCFLTENNLCSDNAENLLSYFDTAYLIYDKIRCLKNKLSQVNQYCKQYDFANNTLKYWVLSFVAQMIDAFESPDAQLARCKNEILKIIRPLETQLYPNGICTEQPEQDAENTAKKNVFTTAQQILFFHYLLDEIGINFGNSDKSQWVRFINSFTGKNAQDIKEKLNFNFDDKKTKRDLRIVADYVAELMPAIAIKIKKDTQE